MEKNCNSERDKCGWEKENPNSRFENNEEGFGLSGHPNLYTKW